MATTEDDVRRIALGLPATTEKPSYGTPGFRVKDKLFARIREEGDVLVLWCEDLGEKDTLVASDPEKFFTTPHYDGYETVLVRLRVDHLEGGPDDGERLAIAEVTPTSIELGEGLCTRGGLARPPTIKVVVHDVLAQVDLDAIAADDVTSGLRALAADAAERRSLCDRPPEAVLEPDDRLDDELLEVVGHAASAERHRRSRGHPALVAHRRPGGDPLLDQLGERDLHELDATNPAHCETSGFRPPSPLQSGEVPALG